MAISLLGQKVGMTRVFSEDGAATPVTVIEVTPNRVSQVKTIETDGYNAVQLLAGTKKASRVNKALAGHYAKAEAEAGRGLWEFRLTEEEVAGYKVGDAIEVNVFEAGAVVDVTGTSKGKGFAGTIKRWNFKGQDATHGNSLSHRVPGSIGQNQTPGRVFNGKKMAGHMGNRKTTVQSLEIVRVDAERNLLLVKGAVPGAAGNDVVVKPAVKG